MLKNCQKWEFDLGHLGKKNLKIQKINPIVIQVFFVFPTPTERGKIKLSKVSKVES